MLLAVKCTILSIFAKRSEAERGLLGNRDVAPGGDVTRWYLEAALQSRPRERQIYVTVLAPRGPPQVWHT